MQEKLNYLETFLFLIKLQISIANLVDIDIDLPIDFAICSLLYFISAIFYIYLTDKLELDFVAPILGDECVTPFLVRANSPST